MTAVITVEVLSPSTRTYDLDQKLAAYHDAGVPAWIVDPDDKSVRGDPVAGLEPAELAASL